MAGTASLLTGKTPKAYILIELLLQPTISKFNLQIQSTLLPSSAFFFFLQNITTCTCNMLILIPNIFNKRGISIYLCKNMFNQSNSGLEWWRERLVKWDKIWSAENTICEVCLDKHLLLLFTQLLAVFYRFFPIKEHKSFRSLYITFFV